MFYVAGPADGHSRWFEAGAAVADRIAAGAVVAGADRAHAARRSPAPGCGNVVACLIFVSAVGRWLGGGLGALAILLAAAGANLLTAAVHRTAFSSLGASTATFAALGLCAGLQVVRRLRGEMRRAYAWVPLGAGLGLYAMLGVGPGADTYAHLFGLGLGALDRLGRGAGQRPGAAHDGADAAGGGGPRRPSSPPGCWPCAESARASVRVGELDGEDRPGAERALDVDGAAEHGRRSA